MTQWLISIVGVVFLGVMLDLLYPNGKTNAFCKSMFAIFALFVIISPLFKVNVETNFNNTSIDSVLIYNLNNAKKQNIEITLKSKLENVGIRGISVEIDTNLYNNDFIINNVYVDISGLVLTDKITNINKYEVITKEIKNVIEIDKERIMIYG